LIADNNPESSFPFYVTTVTVNNDDNNNNNNNESKTTTTHRHRRLNIEGFKLDRDETAQSTGVTLCQASSSSTTNWLDIYIYNGQKK